MEKSAKVIIAGLAAVLAIASGIAVFYASYTERANTETQESVMTSVIGADQTNADKPAQFLFVQHAGSSSLVRDGDGYMLTLSEVSESTIRFADRPYRHVDSMSTGSFVERWSLGNDSFEDDPPNSALVLDGSDGVQKTIVVELLNPVFNDEMQVLTYGVVAAGASGEFTVFERDGSVDPEGDIAGEFGQATLFIDSIDWEFTVPHGFCIADGAIIDCSCDPGYVQDGDRGACVEDTFS